MKVTVARKADADGWKAVKTGTKVIGYISQVGEDWRARVGRTEHLGFATQKDAADKVASLHG